MPPVIPDLAGGLTRSGAGQPVEPAPTVLPKVIATPSTVVTSHASSVVPLPNTLPASSMQRLSPNAPLQPAQVVRAEQLQARDTVAAPRSRQAIQTVRNTIVQYNPIGAAKDTQAIAKANAADRKAVAAQKAVVKTLPSPLLPLTKNPIAVRQTAQTLKNAKAATAKANKANAEAFKALPTPLHPIPSAKPVAETKTTRTNRVHKVTPPVTPPQVRTAMVLGRH